MENKSITENEEFKNNWLEYYKNSNLLAAEEKQNPLVRNGVWLVYSGGAKSCQSILQAEQDKEMIAFAKWCVKGQWCVLGDKWICDNNGREADANGLLDLFRKEQDND